MNNKMLEETILFYKELFDKEHNDYINALRLINSILADPDNKLSENTIKDVLKYLKKGAK